MSEEGGAGRASEFLGDRGKRGDERRGKIGRTLRAGSPATQGRDATREARPAGGKPIRITVDLDPGLHRFLKQYSLDAGARGAAVVRKLLEELRDDPDLDARVREGLADR